MFLFLPSDLRASGFQDKERKMDLIEVLRTVTEGKIYVENERARVTRTLAAIYEKDDVPEKAAKVLQELQVGIFSLIGLIFMTAHAALFVFEIFFDAFDITSTVYTYLDLTTGREL